MKPTLTSFLLVGTLAASAAIFTSCSDDDSASAGGATGTVETENGTAKVSTSDLGLPDGWPSDVPVPANAKVQLAMEMPGTGHRLSFGTQKSVADMVTYYQAEMQKNGWPEGSVTEAGPSSMLSYEKEGRTVMMSLSNSSGIVTAVTITSHNAQ